MRKIYLLILLAIICCKAVGAQPLVLQNEIVFSNGRTIQYNPNNINSHEESCKAEPVIINDWERLILITTNILHEGSVKQVVIYNYHGEQLAKSPLINGEIVFLKKSNRIFLIQESAHYEVDKSFLLDKDGKIVSQLSQLKNVFDFGYSGDEKVVWLLSGHIKNGNPYVIAQVFDCNGTAIKNIESFEEKEFYIKYNNNLYKIQLPAPKISG